MAWLQGGYGMLLAMWRGFLLSMCLLVVAPLLSGCLPFLVRALTDPGGLGTDIATMTADNAVTSLVESDAATGLTEVESTLGRLDELIASGADDAYAGDLSALRNNVDESRHLLQQRNGHEDALMQSNIARGDQAQRRWLEARRLGDIDGDPAFISITDFQQAGQINLDDLRSNAFRPPRHQPNFVGNRFHDRGHIAVLAQGEEMNVGGPMIYGIDMQSGQMRQGLRHGSTEQQQREQQQHRQHLLRSSARRDLPLR